MGRAYYRRESHQVGERRGERIQGRYATVEQGARHHMGARTPAPRSQSLNGVAERMIGWCVTAIRSMLKQANLSSGYWCFAVEYAEQIRNVILNRGSMDPSLTPAEAFTGLKPDVSCMRVFGCVGWAHIHKEIREDASLGDRAVACRFMGMDKLHGTYRVLIGRRKLVRTTNAWFNENAFDVSALGGEEQAKPDAIPLVETPERAVEQAILEAPAQVPTLRTEEEEKHAFQSPAPVRDVRDLGEAATPLASEASEAETIEDPEYQAPEPEGPRRSTRSNRGIPEPRYGAVDYEDWMSCVEECIATVSVS